MNRRKYLATSGGMLALAGCGSQDNSQQPNDQDREPELEDIKYVLYGVESFETREADLTDQEFLEVEPTVVREEHYSDESVESHELDPDEYSVNITAQKTAEDGEYVQHFFDERVSAEFEDETLEELGLLREVDDIQVTDEGTIRVPREYLITGFTELEYDIEVPEADTIYVGLPDIAQPDYEELDETDFNTETVHVRKPREQERNDILHDNPEIKNYLHERAAEIGIEAPGLHEELGYEDERDSIMNEVDESAEGYEFLDQLADVWRDHADRFYNTPSAFARVLSHIIVTESDFRPFVLANSGHNTVLTMDIFEDEMFNVDTGYRTDVVNPPIELQWNKDNPDSSTLHNLNEDSSANSLETIGGQMGQVKVDVRDRLDIDESYAVDAMEEIAEDTDVTPNIFQVMEKVALSGLMHPEFEFSVSGEPGGAEIDFERMDE